MKKIIFCCLVIFFACSIEEPENLNTDPSVSQSVRLKDIASFKVGIQCYIGILDYPIPNNTVKENFQRYTSTAFFWTNTENEPGNFTFEQADKAVSFAQEGNLEVFAHALVYFEPSITPNFIKNFSGSKIEFEQMVKTHIQTIIERYKGKISGYDVINEMVNPSANGGNFYNNILSKYCTSDADYIDFIGKCFIWAHESDPNAKLFYNEAKLEETNQRRLNIVIDLVEKLKQNNIPIHGIGTQTHTDIYTPSSVFDNVFKRLSNTGLKIHVSELDISINENSQATQNPNHPTLTPALADKQKTAYKNIFYSYKTNTPANQQFGITMWDLMDHTSWLNQYRTEFPCMFDKNCDKKPAYYGAAIGILK